MKTKVAVLLIVAAAGLASLASAGPRFGVSVGTGANFCRPAPICQPFVFRSFPAVCYGYAPAYYSWGPTVISYSTGPATGFSNFSPVMSYGESTPVYRVPPPILPAQPITVYPTSSFGWRR